MSSSAIIINLLALSLLIFSFVKNKEKTKQSLKVAIKSFVSILPTVMIIIVFIGLLMGFVPPETISKLDTQSGLFGVIVIAMIGSILFIPSLIAFPLSASLLESGFSITMVAAFIISLTMVGIVTLPLEIKELGKKFALLRTGFSFIIAIVIALIMGVIL